MLDALERQVSRLARLGEAPTDKEPSVASLQRAMADLLARIAALGDGTIEAVERAAEAAVADALGRLPLQGASDIGSIRDDPEDPRRASARPMAGSGTSWRRCTAPWRPSPRACPPRNGM